MHELISTITNLTFILVGLYIYRRSKYVGIMTMLLGVASAGWHWTLQPFWHAMDLIMIYAMLISLIDYSTGSRYTKTAFLAGLGMIGAYFLADSNTIVPIIAFVLLMVLIRHYPPGRVAAIVGFFLLWISTNIPYLHQWEVSFWKLDVLHGVSHMCAAMGILKTVSYKPTTFFELSAAFKTTHLASLDESQREEHERIIDSQLIPAFGSRPVESILQQDVHHFMERIRNSRETRALTKAVQSSLHLIFEFAASNGIRHNPVTVSS